MRCVGLGSECYDCALLIVSGVLRLLVATCGCSMMVLCRCCVRIAVNVWLCLVGVVCLGCVVWLCRVLAATCSVVTFENLLTSVGRRRLQRRRRLRRRRRRKYFPLVGCVKCCVSLETFCVFRAKSTPYNVRDLLCT